MACIVRCRCGQRFKAEDSLAGQRVSCPTCGGPIDVPLDRSAQQPSAHDSSPLRVECCTCGAAFKAPASMAGHPTNCARCGSAMVIPLPGQSMDVPFEPTDLSYPLDYSAPASAGRRYGSAGSAAGQRLVRRPDLITMLQLGLGRFWSVGGAIGVIVCVMLFFYSVERFVYGVKSTPVTIDANAAGVAHNDYVQLTAQLDYNNGIQIETIGGRSYTLVPVAGSDNRLIVHEEGYATASGIAGGNRTFTGRIVAKDFTDEWNLDSDRIRLVQQFAREGITIPSNALVLDASDRPGIQLWAVFLGIFSVGVLLWFGLRVVRTIQLLVDDDKLAQTARTNR